MGIEAVKALTDSIALGHTLREDERMDGHHLDITAKGPQPRKPGLEVLDRWHRDALGHRCAARNGCPEALGQFRDHANDKDRWNIRKVIGPGAEVCHHPLLDSRTISGRDLYACL